MSNSGLPKLEAGVKRTERLRDVRLSPREKANLIATARATGLTVSELVRIRCCLSFTKKTVGATKR